MAITIERESRHIDKSTWGVGPWQSEPDKVQWTDEQTGLPCLAVRTPWSGNWCGYVGVAEGHPAFGVGYGAADKLAPEDDDGYRGLRVHGGLTFADFCQEGAEETGICHVPQPGQPERVWWLGFDCAHCDDLSPATFVTAGERYRQVMRSNPRYAYRTLEYVQGECANLARQLVEVTG
jgi:hypothetical protein